MNETVLIDYGAGNLRSVANALQSLDIPVKIISSGDNFPESPKHIILPGVGSFGDSMNQLNTRKLSEPIRAAIKNNIPFLGICVGYQMLFNSSEEDPEVKGLSIFSGQVKRFITGKKIPHMGWNSTQLVKTEPSYWRGLGQNPYFYFVHSYFPVPEQQEIVCATTDYKEEFASAISWKNLLAVQFHPEKSQHAGLRLIKNFLGHHRLNNC
jgi:imidazole glycerol-phosphate synthase subunit HisH